MNAHLVLVKCSIILTFISAVYGAGRCSDATRRTAASRDVFKMTTAALVPPAQLRMRGPCTSSSPKHQYYFASSQPPTHQLQFNHFNNGRWWHRQQNGRSMSVQRHSQPHTAATTLYSYPKEKPSVIEEGVDVENLELNSSIYQTQSASNTTDSNVITDAGTNGNAGIAHNSSRSSLELWGVPIQSIILLNLVAVIWGTQHAVIKSVVDDSTIGLGTGFVKWVESMGLSLGTLQNSVSSGSSAGSDNTAAYFTLARFGLAALLASPYTPGWHLIKEKLGMGESTSVNGEQLQQEQSDPNSEGATDSRNIDDRESIRLAWKYGAELGLYMFLGYAFQAIGLETTTASRSGFLLYLNVKFVPFFSYFIFGKQIQRSTWISALAAFGGTGLLAFDNANTVGGAENGLGMAFTVGDLWSIAAAAASAMFILRMEAASKAVPKSSELNAANLWTVAALSLLWTVGISWNQSSGADVGADTTEFIHAIQHTFERTTATIISNPLPLIYLSGVTTALANFLQSKAQKDVSAERASVIYAMDPVYGAIFANVLLGETLGGFGVIGAFLIVLAAATNAVLDFGGVSTNEAASGGTRDENKF